MQDELEHLISETVRAEFGADVDVELTRPENQFGDFATNVALQLARKVGKSPREIGEVLAEKIRSDERLADVTVAGPGFLNLLLTDTALLDSLAATQSKPYEGKTVVAEYSDPNPFKVLHAGHFYTSVVGDAIANLFAYAGAKVHRVNFGGDVGLHVGKTMWAIVHELGGELPEKLADIPENERSEWMAKCYVAGTNAYEDDEAAKAEIIAMNKRVYGLHAENDHDTPFAQIYWTCRGWSYDYFNAFYARIGSGFERYYPESETAPVGLVAVKEQLANGVFKESDGAVVFDGEAHGLHTRVFINSEGLPTYEAKDVGLSLKKWEDYHFDTSVIITGNDIVEYMKVVLKAIEQFEPNLAQRTQHITHGNVKLAGGVKMSSRKGNFLRAVDVLEAAEQASQAAAGQSSEDTVLAAIKYSFLKNRIGADIIFDPAESVSIVGNSGPYLQYAHARARSILSKVSGGEEHILTHGELETDERRLLRKLTEFPEVITKATNELMPHHICTYLYELAQDFNRFYEENRVVGDPREELRLGLVQEYADTLRQGLTLLGISAPERM
ncbi:arginine--tRNA ligase [Candidatus Saccharibacteria bacterium]|nr:arginine--tRNA ligase [Candidatus Saccharibacteria bacterium]